MTTNASDFEVSGILRSGDDVIAQQRITSLIGVLQLADRLTGAVKLARLVAINFNPALGAGEPLCPGGSIAMRTDVPGLYLKTADAPDTAWVPLSTGAASLVMPLVNVAAPAVLPAAGSFYQVSVPAGSAAVTLPLASSVPNGASLAIRLVPPQTGVLTVDASGADTVNNLPAVDFPGNGPDDRYSAIYVSDGVSAWRSLGDDTVFPSIFDDGQTLFLNPQAAGANVNVANTIAIDSATFTAVLGASEFNARFHWGQDDGTGVITPPALAVGNTNDYSPAGLNISNTLRLSTAIGSLLTGIAASVYTAPDGVMLMLVNVGANPLVLVNNATSTASNRFACPGNVNYTIASQGGAWIRYDATSARWRVVDNA